MKQESITASAIGSRRFEKDPDLCLVYRIFGASGAQVNCSEFSDKLSLLAKQDSLEARSAQSDIKICADGDSWINILIEFSHALGYNKTFFDVLEERYRTSSTACPGDTFEQMLQEKTFKVHIDSGINDFFIFSGGGVDVLGGGALTRLLRTKAEGGGSSDPEKYLNLDRIDAALRKLKSGYLEIAQYVKVRSPRTVMLVHGYDYPVAQADGPWLGTPFLKRNFDIGSDRALVDGILAYLVDRFYGMLEDVARNISNVTVVDVRNVVKGRWTDELHPKKAASEDIAAVYQNVMEGSPVA
ncbi:hypothetical protein [Roseibium sp.]|uniref:hypothetical protein n=2 Tax=Roseibium sp. TaxID=1936156 RepID=UPI0032641C05